MTIRTVLLVDDDPMIRVLAELAFTAVGRLETHTAAGGFEALDQARLLGPDVIVLDVAMPDLNGVDTLRQLRAAPSTANIPVVFLTGAVERADIVRYLEVGADGVLAKPFQPMQLAAHLQRVVDGEVCIA